MTPTDTDRFLARVKQRAEDGCGFAAEDMLRVLSVVEGLSRELLEAKAHRPAQAAAAANLTSLVGLVREVMADTGAEWLGVVSDDGQMLSRWDARAFLADLSSLLTSVGAPLGAAPALSAEGSIPSLPCPSTPTEERWVAFVSDDRGWVCDSLSEARHTIEDELGARTQEGDEWGGDEEEMWGGRVQITERVTEIYRGPDPSGRHDEVVNYALRPVSPPSSPTPPAAPAGSAPASLSCTPTGSEGGLAIHLEMRPEEEIDLASLAMPPLKEIDPADVSRMRDALSRMRTCPDCTGRATRAGGCLTCAGTGFVGVP